MQDKRAHDIPLPPAAPAAPAPTPAAVPSLADRLRWRFAGALSRGRARVDATGLARLRHQALHHPGRLLAPLAAARRLRPHARFLAQAEALLTARARGWEAARPRTSWRSSPPTTPAAAPRWRAPCPLAESSPPT
jgi:hypothetical protein